MPTPDLYSETSDLGVAFFHNYFTEMCSGSEAGSYLRLIDFVYHSTLGLRVIKKKKRSLLPFLRFRWWSHFGQHSAHSIKISKIRKRRDEITGRPVGQGAECRVQGAGCRVQDAGCRVQGAGCRVQGAGCRVQGVGVSTGVEVEAGVERLEGGEALEVSVEVQPPETVHHLQIV